MCVCVCVYTHTTQEGESERKKLLEKYRDWPIRANVTRRILNSLVWSSIKKKPRRGPGPNLFANSREYTTHFLWNRQLFFLIFQLLRFVFVVHSGGTATRKCRCGGKTLLVGKKKCSGSKSSNISEFDCLPIT